MEETISLKELFQTLRKRWMLILLLTLSAGLIGGVISYYVLTPVYQSSTQILVNQKNNQTPNMGQVQFDLQLINTYSDIIKSPVILEKVIDKLELKQSVGALNQKISVHSKGNSQVFLITVVDTDPVNATKIVNTVSETFEEEIPNIMNIDNVRILSEAVLKENPAPIKPNPEMNIAIALLVGLMAGIGLAFLLEYLDNTIKDAQDIEKNLGLPVLGSIQKITKNHEKGQKKTAKRIGSETIWAKN